MAKNKNRSGLETKAEMIANQEIRIQNLESQLSSLKIEKSDMESGLFDGDWENDENGREELLNMEDEIADLESKYQEAVQELQYLQG